ncbi:MAG: hypothetical protein PWQ58_1610 [Archaeoglobaceae archaeon]|nr:hypothetical protein [Archaeoglobaceae archaeon]
MQPRSLRLLLLQFKEEEIFSKKGVLDVIVKPFKVRELLDRIEKVNQKV